MDKHEYKHLMDEIQYLIDQQEYAKAAEIADTIDWRRVRSIMTLGTISDLYRINKRYEDARDIMLMAYDRKPENSQVCYSLCELFLKTGEMADAVEFYKEYERLTNQDPQDFGKYILQYKMYEANNVSLEERAEVLENLRQRTHQEKWLYELAYLYHRMELETKCVEVCDELILWFGTGEYVNKALELKRLHAPLTPEQQEKYDRRFENTEDAPEEDGPEDGESVGDVLYEDQEEDFESGESDPTETTRVFDTEEVRRQAGDYAADGDTAPMVKIMDMGQYNTLNLQAEIAAGVNEVLGDTDSITRTLLQPMIDPETGYYDLGSTTEIINSVSQDPEEPEYMENSEVYFGETGEIQQNTGEIQGAEDEAAGEYAAEAFDGEPYAEDGAAEEYAAEAFDREPYAENEEIEDGGEESVPGGNVTEDFLDPKQDEDTVFLDYPDEEVLEEEPAESIGTQEDGAYADSYIGYVEKDSDSEKEAGKNVSIADRVMEQMRLESLETQKKLENEALTAQPPEPMARALTQEPDGQIRLVVPEGKTLEKQITGQLSIEDIRAEWERMKQESREKQEEEVRQRVQRQTGKMFTEFEEAIRDNILRQMEQKEEPSLYESPEAVQQDGEETEQEETGGWAMDEWMSDTGEPEDGESEDEAAAPEEMASEEYAENAGDDTSEKDADGTENAEETVEQEIIPEKPGEGSGEHTESSEETEELPEESEEIPEESEEIPESFEEVPEETEEIPEESEEIPEETEELPEETEEIPEESEEIPEESEELPEETKEISEEILEESGAVSSGSEETAEEEQAEEEQSEESQGAAEEEEGYEDTKEPTEEVNVPVTGNSWEDDEYPDFSEEEKAVLEAAPDEEEASKEDEDQGEEALNDREAEESAGEDTASEVPSVRPLTDEEEALFGELVRGRSAREQLVKAIDNISMAAYAGNLVITGEESSSALEMAKNMIREIKQTDSNFSGKAAKISGKKLSGKDVSAFLEQLKNGAIIIESASQLSANTLEELYKCMQQDSYGLLVILTDTKKKMNLFLKENKKFVPLFSARVDLQPLSNDVLAEYAQQYAREREYSIDDLGMLALHTRIDEMQTAKHSVTKAEIEQLMDAAIHSAAKKNMGHFFDILLGRRYDEEDMLIITEKDFE